MTIASTETIADNQAAGSSKAAPKKFGTFYGVYLPNILSIFGVIMYLRMGWVLGNVGLWPMIAMILLGSLITFITGLSISSIATNREVGGGGAYYVISRSFGVEIGSAIGLPLYIAQITAVAFYLEGFSESFCALLPWADAHLVETLALVGITALACFSSSFTMKAQLYIFLIIVASIVSILFGSYDGSAASEMAAIELPKVGFWHAFAIFFPALTGIGAGFSMSGDLESPKKSLPMGTLASVLTGAAVYIMLAIVMWSIIPRATLISNPLIVQKAAYFESFVILGIWGATLSSAIGGIMGAPRVLQALANDRIVPKFLGKGVGISKEPVVATICSFVIALVTLYYGSIDLIAPILSMFFLISYGMLNLASGIEGLLGNPSWRPSFRTPWVISFSGALLSLMAMLVIDPGYTFVAIFILILFYVVIKKRGLVGKWDDMRQGILLYMSRVAVYGLAKMKVSSRSWRPYFLVFAGSPAKHSELLDFANAITKGKGFLTVASIVSEQNSSRGQAWRLEEATREYLEKRHVEALVVVEPSENLFDGIEKLVTSYGLDPIVPNTVMMGESDHPQNASQFAGVFRNCLHMQKNVLVLTDVESGECDDQIDIWWDEKDKKNSQLMILLACMLKGSKKWSKSKVFLKCTVKNEVARQQRLAYMKEYVKESRLDLEPKVLVLNEAEEEIKVSKFSSKSALTFIGLRPPQEDESLEKYGQYFARQQKIAKSLHQAALVMSAEDIDLQQIFK